MKIQALKLLSKEEMMKRKVELMREKLALLVLKRQQELKETHKLRMIRRQIAQINTLIGTNPL